MATNVTAIRIRMVTLLVVLLFMYQLRGAVIPSKYAYGDYGLKIAMNDILFVQVQNQYKPPIFLVQFAPYEQSSTSWSHCNINLPNATDHYIYTVAIGRHQTGFFFAGELFTGRNGTFVGVAKYNTSSTSCDTRFAFEVTYFYNYGHQEYYVIDVESSGRYAYGFANQFVFVFDAERSFTLDLWSAYETWLDRSFIPHAVDILHNYGVLAGFVRRPVVTATAYIPMIYLLRFSSAGARPTVVDYYHPNATPYTWQDLLTNSDAGRYSAKYDMSVSIEEDGDVLVGMQFINRVFLLSVNRINSSKLNFISRYTNGRSLGNGKSVAWLDNGIAAVLINTYTLDYRWNSSRIYLFDIGTNGYNSTSTPLSIFPNNHQLLPSRFSPVFLSIVSSPSTLALLDDRGNVLIINTAPSGFFPVAQDTGISPFFTMPRVCFPGSYKNQSGLHDCSLCPPGTKNSGNSSIQCMLCASGSYCSLGSVDDVPASVLATTMQVIAYPKSPENTKFQDILLENTFHITSCTRLYASPIFWSLIVLAFGIATCLLISTKQITEEYASRTKWAFLRQVFQHADLIQHGKSMTGGLISIAALVSIGSIVYLSLAFQNQYPVEKPSHSNFACDRSQKNAKFQTSLQSLSIPSTSDEQTMFDLLNAQVFTLNVQFVNTLISCDAISIRGLYDEKWYSARWLTCANKGSILTIAIPLPHQDVTVQVLLDDVKTIGALRVGLSANGTKSEQFSLRELDFYYSLIKPGQVLAQSLPITLGITKVINETLPLSGVRSIFSGIFVPTFNVDLKKLFLSNDQYVRSTLPSTMLTIALTETPYYVKNVQKPITKSSEMVFDTLLSAMVCLDLSAVIFLVYTLAIKPVRACQYWNCLRRIMVAKISHDRSKTHISERL